MCREFEKGGRAMMEYNSNIPELNHLGHHTMWLAKPRKGGLP